MYNKLLGSRDIGTLLSGYLPVMRDSVIWLLICNERLLSGYLPVMRDSVIWLPACNERLLSGYLPVMRDSVIWLLICNEGPCYLVTYL